MDSVMKNAERVLKDGKILESTNSPTATFLYAIAIEELSKAYYLGLIAINILEKQDINWEKFWKDFRSHKFKQTGLIKMVIVGQNLIRNNFEDIKKRHPEFLGKNRTINDIDRTINSLVSTIKDIENGKIEKIKWEHLYVDYLNNKWRSPSNLERGLLTRGNVETYLIDLNTMKKQIEDEMKKRNWT